MSHQVKCPICNIDVGWNSKSIFRPFCSERCRLIDLGDWANENHAIAGKDGEADWLKEDDGSTIDKGQIN